MLASLVCISLAKPPHSFANRDFRLGSLTSVIWRISSLLTSFRVKSDPRGTKMRFSDIRRRVRAAGLASAIATLAVTSAQAQSPQVDYDLVPQAAAVPDDATEAVGAAQAPEVKPQDEAAAPSPAVENAAVSPGDNSTVENSTPVEAEQAVKESTPDTAALETPKVEEAKPEAAAPAAAAPAAPAVADADRELATRLAARLESEGWGQVSESRDGNDAGDRKALAAYYKSPDATPLWVRDGAVDAKGNALVATLKSAGDWGLSSASFADAVGVASGSGSADDKELALSLAALKYARHARGGRIMAPAEDLSSYLDRKPQLIAPEEVIAALNSAGDVKAYMEDLNPPQPAFANLRKALLKIRHDRSEAEAVVKIPESGPLLRLGATHPDVALIRERLGVPPSQGAVDESADPNTFDEAVEAAIKSFQEENDLRPDGVVGRRTRSAFNGGPREISEDMLIANMEMWRWMPRDLGKLYVMVNIPEFEVRVVKDGNIIHDERIISGKTNNQTPIFSDEMETIVFNPTWGVPNSIKVNELLPSLARGGSTFERQNLRLSYNGRDVDPRTVNWAQADIRNYHVYQPPGGGNVLGVVKFLFPNHHQVYMHDTPSKSLFNSSNRAYSHGCMRVRNPLRLAEILLEADKSWPASRVNSMVGGSNENPITLEHHIPVHVVYQTAIADQNGTVRTVSDIYRHEERVRYALAGDWNSIPRHRNHLAPVQIDRAKIQALAAPKYQPNPVDDLFKAIFGGFN